MANMRQISSSCKLESMPALEAINAFGKWLDLPDYLMEKILERLPIFDYVRFGAVCRQWRIIQENHSCVSPPAMLNLPWFIPREPQQEPVDCFSPFPEEDQQSHRIRIPLSRRYLRYGEIESKGRSWHFSLPNGWLVLDDIPGNAYYYFTLMNPISRVQFELPSVGNGLYMNSKLAASPPPNCLVFLMAYDKWNMFINLYREGDSDWTELQFPDQNMQRGRDSVSMDETSAIVWKGKVYYMYLSRGLMVIDPLPTDPTVEFLDMDQSQLPELRCGWVNNVQHTMELFMVESNGKLLLVIEFFEFDETIVAWHALVGFQVFEADFSSNRRWVRVESLGDRVLFIHKNFVCSMLAADIGVEGNCIYCLDPSNIYGKKKFKNSYREEPVPWSVFNLGTGKVTESPLSYAPTPYTHLMFLPSLC